METLDHVTHSAVSDADYRSSCDVLFNTRAGGHTEGVILESRAEAS